MVVQLARPSDLLAADPCVQGGEEFDPIIQVVDVVVCDTEFDLGQTSLALLVGQGDFNLHQSLVQISQDGAVRIPAVAFLE